MSKTTRTPSNDGITDVTQCTIQQLTCLPAEVLCLHLSSHNLGTKAVMARRLYNGIHPPPSSDVTPVSIATTATQPGLSSPSSTSATGTSTLQATLSLLLPPQPSISANISPLNLPPDLQAQLSSLMAQFLQNATPTTSAPVTSESTDNLSPASTINTPRHLPMTIVHTPLLPSLTMACAPLQLPATVTHAQLQPTMIVHTQLQPMTIVHVPLQLLATIAHTQLQSTVVHAPQQLPTAISHAPLQQTMIASSSFPANYATPTLPAHQSLEIIMPPVPTQLRQRI